MYDQNTLHQQALTEQRNRQYTKEFFAKPFILVSAIIILVVAVLNNLISFFGSFAVAPLIDRINEMLEATGYGGEPGISVSANASLPITTILFILALILLYIKSRKKNDTSPPTAGATMFQVWAILSSIGDFLLASLALLLPILIFIGIDALFVYKDTPVAETITEILPFPYIERGLPLFGLMFAIFFVATAALLIVMSVSRLKFASSLKNSALKGSLQKNGATLFAVMNIFYAVYVLFGVLCVTPMALITDTDIPSEFGQISEILQDIPLNILLIVSVSTTLLSAVTPIILAKFALRYKKHITIAGENGINLPEPELLTAPIESANNSEEEPVFSSSETIVQSSVKPVAEVIDDNPYAGFADTPAEHTEPEAVIETTTEPTPDTTASSQFCPMCNAPVSPGHKFCSICGNKLID